MQLYAAQRMKSYERNKILIAVYFSRNNLEFCRFSSEKSFLSSETVNNERVSGSC